MASSSSRGEHVTFQRPFKRLPAPGGVPYVGRKRIDEHGSPVSKTLPPMLIPNTWQTVLIACPRGTRVYLPIPHEQRGQGLRLGRVGQSTQRHHRVVLVKLTSRQPTQRSQRAANVVVLALSGENPGTKVDALLDPLGQLPTGRPIH